MVACLAIRMLTTLFLAPHTPHTPNFIGTAEKMIID